MLRPFDDPNSIWAQIEPRKDFELNWCPQIINLHTTTTRQLVVVCLQTQDYLLRLVYNNKIIDPNLTRRTNHRSNYLKDICQSIELSIYLSIHPPWCRKVLMFLCYFGSFMLILSISLTSPPFDHFPTIPPLSSFLLSSLSPYLRCCYGNSEQGNSGT